MMNSCQRTLWETPSVSGRSFGEAGKRQDAVVQGQGESEELGDDTFIEESWRQRDLDAKQANKGNCISNYSSHVFVHKHMYQSHRNQTVA
jgi:hypothetical protein